MYVVNGQNAAGLWIVQAVTESGVSNVALVNGRDVADKITKCLNKDEA
jgi:hypothetical protein